MAIDPTATQPDSVEPYRPRLIPARSIRRRKHLERATYGAATLGITIAPHYDQLWPAHLAALGLTAGTACWLWNKWETTDIGLGLLNACQKALPLLTGAGLYVANLMRPGADMWEYALPAGWGVLMAATTPLTHALGLIPAPPAPHLPALEQATSPSPDAQPLTFTAYRTNQWDTAKTTGPTHLAEVHQYQEGAPDFWGVVVAEEGDAVPDLNPTTLAAVFDLPPGTVTLHLIQNSGPGRKLLQARPTLDARQQAAQDPLVRIFDERLARKGGGADGMTLVAHRSEENRIVFRVAAPDDAFIQLNQKQIARSIGYKDPSLVMVETDGLGDGIISIYKTHPLLDVREATVDDLTMRPDGTIRFGVQPDGRLAPLPLYDPQLGALTDLFVGAMGAGKSVALNTVLAAERISGVVSIVADAQNGMSLPEADGRVYHFGKGIAAVAATLAAAYEVAQYREKVSSENGWAGFELNDPWPLANITLDELNRILSEDALVPRDFKKWVVGLVGDFQSTGRKFGMGIRFAAQSIHLADLGDKDKIRANAKNGTVWLGRTNSSTTNHMATDGVIPPGVVLEPIRPNFATGNDIDAAFTGQEAAKGPRTAGMANNIQGGTVFLARVFKAVKQNKTYPGLIKLYESAPIRRLTQPEDDIFTRAYAKWLPHAEALLAGDDDTEALENTGYTGTASLDDLEDEDDGQPSTGTIKDRILTLLADGPMALKDVRKHMSDASAGSVNNAMAELREAGHVTAISRGTYQLAN